MRTAAGFSIVEALVATALMLGVAAAAFAALNPAHAAFQAQAEASDEQQRLRVAVSALWSDLVAAGSGADRGPLAVPLLRAFAPILPYRRGSTSDDPPGSAFGDRITIVSVPAAAPSTTLAPNGPPLDSSSIGATPQPQCPVTDPLCLFSAGTDVAIVDGRGSVDFVTITAVSSSLPMPTLQHANDRLAFIGYPPTATSIAGVSVVSYAFDRVAAQLVVSRGLGAPEAAVADNVVGVAFAYLGDPQPPQLATYGPLPPPVDVQGASAEWPPGENCVFAVSGNVQVPRLPILDGGPGVVPLPLSLFGDGPWCPDSTAANRWDADLLRIRALVITVRVQAAIAALRGPAGLLFVNAGTGADSGRWVADREIHIQVSPRNLNLARAP
jgi:type II secretory pathway pseudopilin PulG